MKDTQRKEPQMCISLPLLLIRIQSLSVGNVNRLSPPFIMGAGEDNDNKTHDPWSLQAKWHSSRSTVWKAR